eukprot:TRINITY_DN23083_c0_g1_i1.p1 TRINITY_DN23083_c0_g1~~TRINITY_DN23083_c0_g1_i1.p1  ORF type:complete len:372 (+),score=45.59 TRINITY_DN23083_c0_g1_i1:122-1237(+)
MPLYEEKLLSPLAIRFTQEHIRPHFRDGRVVETTIPEIVACDGVGEYDVILRVPFPLIEVVRFSPSHRCGKGGAGGKHYHWFSFDNRRLYCLQKAAVSLWPRRAAVAVQVFHASDPAAVRRKVNTTSKGRSVEVRSPAGHDMFEVWSWRKGVCVDDAAGSYAQAAISKDDRRPSVCELSEVPSGMGLPCSAATACGQRQGLLDTSSAPVPTLDAPWPDDGFSLRTDALVSVLERMVQEQFEELEKKKSWSENVLAEPAAAEIVREEAEESEKDRDGSNTVSVPSQHSRYDSFEQSRPVELSDSTVPALRMVDHEGGSNCSGARRPAGGCSWRALLSRLTPFSWHTTAVIAIAAIALPLLRRSRQARIISSM